MLRFFRRGRGGQVPTAATPNVAVPNTGNLVKSLGVYVNAVRASGANQANIRNVKNKMNAVILAGTQTAVAPMTGPAAAPMRGPPPRGTSNQGLTQSWMNLQSSMNSLNRKVLANLAGQVRGAMAALQQTPNPPEAQLVSAINKNLRKANAILAANSAANTQIKAFIAATKIANNKNANNQARALNAAYAALPEGLVAVFNKNKANANAAIARVRQRQGANLKGVVVVPGGVVKEKNGTRYFKNTGNGWRVVNKNANWAPSTTNTNKYSKNANNKFTPMTGV